MTQVIWDPDLIRRYDLTGPRYTSYPTAPQFQDALKKADYEALLQRSNNSGKPLSLYCHIPFCDTVCYYCACNKVITANKSRARPYLDSMKAEMQMVAEKIDPTRQVDQLHWGGGTPTYISDDEKRELMAYTRQCFNLRNDDSGEYSIEVHPGRMDVATVSLLREIGFNRLSIGVQDFDPLVQRAVNRFNSVDQVFDIVERARREKFHSISMDLIYGLPLQNLQTFSATLENVIALSPERLSIFNYAHLPHMFKVQKQIDESQLPSADEKLAMMQWAVKRLTQVGYNYIGMDHFAKPTDELSKAQERGDLQRNFQGYSTHGNCDLLAFGVSAISAIDDCYIQNHKQIASYREAVDAGHLPIAKGLRLDADDLLRKKVINRIICQFELTFADIEREFAIDFFDYFAPELHELDSMRADGLLEYHEGGFKVTPQGRLLIRRICMVFDIYLQKPSQQASPAQKYSKII